MSNKDELAWMGSPRVRRTGGFVDGVAMNEPVHQLAVDPNGKAVDDRDRPSERAGPQLSVTRLGKDADGPVQRNGRVRLNRT